MWSGVSAAAGLLAVHLSSAKEENTIINPQKEKQEVSQVPRQCEAGDWENNNTAQILGEKSELGAIFMSTYLQNSYFY